MHARASLEGMAWIRGRATPRRAHMHPLPVAYHCTQLTLEARTTAPASAAPDKQGIPARLKGINARHLSVCVGEATQTPRPSTWYHVVGEATKTPQHSLLTQKEPTRHGRTASWTAASLPVLTNPPHVQSPAVAMRWQRVLPPVCVVLVLVLVLVLLPHGWLHHTLAAQLRVRCATCKLASMARRCCRCCCRLLCCGHAKQAPVPIRRRLEPRGGQHTAPKGEALAAPSRPPAAADGCRLVRPIRRAHAPDRHCCCSGRRRIAQAAVAPRRRRCCWLLRPWQWR